MFIAAFGKNNSQMHYQPVGGIDAADKVAALKVASAEALTSAYKREMPTIKHVKPVGLLLLSVHLRGKASQKKNKYQNDNIKTPLNGPPSCF